MISLCCQYCKIHSQSVTGWCRLLGAPPCVMVPLASHHVAHGHVFVLWARDPKGCGSLFLPIFAAAGGRAEMLHKVHLQQTAACGGHRSTHVAGFPAHLMCAWGSSRTAPGLTGRENLHCFQLWDFAVMSTSWHVDNHSKRSLQFPCRAILRLHPCK